MGSNSGINRSGFLGVLSKMMAIVLAVMTVITVSPTGSYATMPTAITSASAVVSNNNTTVTVTFNTYATPTTDLVDLKSKIQIGRSGANSFVDLSADNANNNINMVDGTLFITLGTALTGTTNAINVKTGSLMNRDGIASNTDVVVSNISARDITAPVFIGSTSGNQGRNVDLNFDEDLFINAPDDSNNDQIQTFLKSNLSVSTDGVNFSPFLETGIARKNNSRVIHLEYPNNIKIILGANTIVKIASGTIRDAEGNINQEMKLPVSPPVIQSTEVSSDNHKVTITFDKDIYENTNGSNLKNRIYLYKGDGSNGKGLVATDTVSITSNKLIIDFTEALTGASNQISIGGNTLRDSYGNTQGDDRLTAVFQENAGGVDPNPKDTTMPKFLYATFPNFQDLTLVFDEDVFNAKNDIPGFLQNVQWYENGWLFTLPTNTTVTFSGHKAVIHFAVPLTGSQFYFSFYPGHFKDASGNILTGYTETNWFYTDTPNLALRESYFSQEGRWLSLAFKQNNVDINLVDQTIVGGISQLHGKIAVSLDNGLTYTALNPLDIVSVQGNKINIFFHNAIKQGSIKVKVEAEVVSNPYDTYRNEALDELIASRTPEITGYLLSNTASEFVFADNDAWRTKVRAVNVFDEKVGRYRELTSSEYSLSAGKLTITKGVFQEGQSYQVYIDADGYSTQYFWGFAYKSSEIFYMTAPAVTAENGITAKINLVNNANKSSSNGNQTVIFELFNGSSPVSIVASNLKIGTGTYSANFNVADAGTNTNYTVKAFVVSQYSNSSTNIGLNLATVKTQFELDQALLNGNNNNNEED
ncbi:hemoblobin-interacting domain-containing protein [Paenibacillus ferrarius]|nr:hemoblobin-interacting domain-containing protein [Paenibacillus ferrarius]